MSCSKPHRIHTLIDGSSGSVFVQTFGRLVGLRLRVVASRVCVFCAYTCSYVRFRSTSSTVEHVLHDRLRQYVGCLLCACVNVFLHKSRRRLLVFALLPLRRRSLVARLAQVESAKVCRIAKTHAIRRRKSASPTCSNSVFGADERCTHAIESRRFVARMLTAHLRRPCAAVCVCVDCFASRVFFVVRIVDRAEEDASQWHIKTNQS